MSTLAPPIPLAQERIAEASAMLAAAFYDDPLSRFFFPREEARRRWLRLAHDAGLRQVLPEGHVHWVGGDEIAGVIGLVPPGRLPLPTWRSLRFIVTLAWRLPSGGFPLNRVIRSFQAMRLMERLHLREPHWYVSVLGVHPTQQGKGLGRALLEPALARADRERLPTYLETSNERNLLFYGHFGFDVVKEVETPGGGPPMWTMLRLPVA